MRKAYLAILLACGLLCAGPAPSAFAKTKLSFAFVTDPTHEAERRALASAGVQADFRLVTLSHLDSTLSFGYAAAGGEGVPTSSAFMFSFKIM